MSVAEEAAVASFYNLVAEHRQDGGLRPLAEYLGLYPSYGERIRGEYERMSQALGAPVAAQRFGRYDLLSQLGQGGQGTVYLARDLVLDRKVALKILRSWIPGADTLQRFEREARVAAQLRDPGLCEILDYGDHEGHPFLVMPHVEAPSLRDLLAAEQKRRTVAGDELSRKAREAWQRRMVSLLLQVCRSTAVAHESKVIHRDLKPGNILVQDGDRPVIVDFGLAMDIEAAEESLITRTGDHLGSLSYMAPEQLDGSASTRDPRVDVHALGVVLYEALALELPYRGETPKKISDRILESRAPSLRAFGVPDELALVVATCLEKEQDHRYRSAKELAEDLERWLNGVPVAASVPGRWRRIRAWIQREPRVASLLLLVSLVALVAIVSLSSSLRAQRALREQVRTSRRLTADLAIRNAAVACEDGDRALAEMFLQSCDPSIRGPEWDHLARLLDRARSRIVLPEGAGRIRVFGSVDGPRAASVVGERFELPSELAEEWISRPQRFNGEVQDFMRHANGVTSVLWVRPPGADEDVDPPGWTLHSMRRDGASSSESRWSLDGGTEVEARLLPEGDRALIRWRRDGYGAHRLELVDLRSGASLWRRDFQAQIHGFCLGPRGRWVAVSGTHFDHAALGRFVSTIDLRDGNTRAIAPRDDWEARGLAFGPTGRRLALIELSHEHPSRQRVSVLDTESLRPRAPSRIEEGLVPQALHFSSDGARLLIGQSNGGIAVHEASLGSPPFRICAHRAGVIEIAPLASSSGLYTRDEHGEVLTWDTEGLDTVPWPLPLRGREAHHHLMSRIPRLTPILMSEDGARALRVAGEELVLFDLDRLRLRGVHAFPSLGEVCLAEDQHSVIVSCAERQWQLRQSVVRWDPESDGVFPLHTLDSNEFDLFVALRRGTKSDQLALLIENRLGELPWRLRVISEATGALLWQHDLGRTASRLLCEKGRPIVVVTEEAEPGEGALIRWFDSRGWQRGAQRLPVASVGALSFFPGSEDLLFGAGHRLLRWSPTRRRVVWEVTVGNVVGALVGVPRSDRFLSVHEDGRLHFRSLRTGRSLCALGNAGAGLSRVAVSHGGHRILASGRGGAYLWDCDRTSPFWVRPDVRKVAQRVLSSLPQGPFRERHAALRERLAGEADEGVRAFAVDRLLRESGRAERMPLDIGKLPFLPTVAYRLALDELPGQTVDEPVRRYEAALLGYRLGEFEQTLGALDELLKDVDGGYVRKNAKALRALAAARLGRGGGSWPEFDNSHDHEFLRRERELLRRPGGLQAWSSIEEAVRQGATPEELRTRLLRALPGSLESELLELAALSPAWNHLVAWTIAARSGLSPKDYELARVRAQLAAQNEPELESFRLAELLCRYRLGRTSEVQEEVASATDPGSFAQRRTRVLALLLLGLAQLDTNATDDVLQVTRDELQIAIGRDATRLPRSYRRLQDRFEERLAKRGE